MEKVGNVPKLKHLGLPDDVEMAINCEVCLLKALGT
jgi:hexokinase